MVPALLRDRVFRRYWSAGTISMFGDQISGIALPLAAVLALHVGAAQMGDLTALENLRFSVGLKRRCQPDELRAALERTQVAACADLPARVLSAGQRRRVSLARVIAMQASVWLLDEPYANLDAAGSELVSELLQAHVTAGGLALVVAHRELALACKVRRLELNS